MSKFDFVIKKIKRKLTPVMVDTMHRYQSASVSSRNLRQLVIFYGHLSKEPRIRVEVVAEQMFLVVVEVDGVCLLWP